LTPAVIRILGASYSGSTALGYFLNTAPGFVFGSELYRLLPAFASARPGDAESAFCDHCGPDCKVWSPALRSALRGDPEAGLAQVYELFFAMQPQSRVLVDGSKSLAWYTSGPMPRQRLHYLVSVKHPVRLVASYLYNDRRLVPAQARSTLATCGHWLATNPDRIRPVVETVCLRLADQYRALRGFTETDARWCRTDDPGDVEQVLASIGTEFGVEMDPQRMHRMACHSIGGNRSLVWQSKAFAERPGSPRQDNARWAYYRQNRGSGFVQDNKFEILFAGPALDWVMHAARRHDLFQLLGYGESP
jgi:hypothetical protein